MRILMISWEYPPYVVGGMGKHAAELAPVLGGRATRYDNQTVDVLTTGYGGGRPVEKCTPNVCIHRVEMPPLDPIDLYNTVIENNDHFISYARALAADQPYDLIHIHDWLPGVAGMTLKYEWKCPLLTTIHATERGRHHGHTPSNTSSQIDALEWQVCHEAWKVIVCSRYMVGELHHFFHTPQDKIQVIPNGIALDRLHICPPETKAALRARYAPNGERLLFFVGRITHEKGLQVLIRAMPQILAEHPNTRLLVAGKNSRKMVGLARELDVDQSITFLDYITDEERDHLYQIVDAAIFPSLYEPFGIVALEAMALGCNVIVSDVGGLGEVVKHLETGLTVYPDNPESIAWAVSELFRDPEAAQRRRARALETVATDYTWQGIGEHTTRLYEEIVTARHNTAW